jgi:hypothetical protein
MKKLLDKKINEYKIIFNKNPKYIILNPEHLAKLREELKIDIMTEFNKYKKIKLLIDINIEKITLSNDSSIRYYEVNC